MSKDWTEGGPPAPAICNAVTITRYSYGGGPGPTAHGPDDATSSADADRARAREMSELSDYVRLLAGRMGLEDWTFEVAESEAIALGEFAEAQTEYRRPRYARLYVTGGFFEATPEARRLAIAREMVYLLISSTDDLTTFDPTAAASAIAAAWAPCLPLPLVGWMRRAGDTKEIEAESS